jgi:hypothetical protein
MAQILANREIFLQYLAKLITTTNVVTEHGSEGAIRDLVYPRVRA